MLLIYTYTCYLNIEWYISLNIVWIAFSETIIRCRLCTRSVCKTAILGNKTCFSLLLNLVLDMSHFEARQFWCEFVSSVSYNLVKSIFRLKNSEKFAYIKCSFCIKFCLSRYCDAPTCLQKNAQICA